MLSCFKLLMILPRGRALRPRSRVLPHVVARNVGMIWPFQAYCSSSSSSDAPSDSWISCGWSRRLVAYTRLGAPLDSSSTCLGRGGESLLSSVVLPVCGCWVPCIVFWLGMVTRAVFLVRAISMWKLACCAYVVVFWSACG